MQQHMRIRTYWQASKGAVVSQPSESQQKSETSHTQKKPHTYSCKRTYTHAHTLTFYKNSDGTSRVYINVFRHQEAPSSFSQFPYETTSNQQQVLRSHHEHHLLHYPGLQRLLEERNGRCMDKTWPLLLCIQVHRQGFWPPWINIFWALYSRPGTQPLWVWDWMDYLTLEAGWYAWDDYNSEKQRVNMKCLIFIWLNLWPV